MKPRLTRYSVVLALVAAASVPALAQLGGQAPQPGVAVLDINAAVTPLGDPVSSHLPGPYRAIAYVDEMLTFDFEGDANQDIFLLAGDLLPGAVPAPPYGQVDLGAPFVATSGLSNPVMRTDATGHRSVAVSLAPSLAGSFVTFQAVIPHSNASVVLGISNAVSVDFSSVEVTSVNPLFGKQGDDFIISGSNLDPANTCVLVAGVASARVDAGASSPSALHCTLGAVGSAGSGDITLVVGTMGTIPPAVDTQTPGVVAVWSAGQKLTGGRTRYVGTGTAQSNQPFQATEPSSDVVCATTDENGKMNLPITCTFNDGDMACVDLHLFCQDFSWYEVTDMVTFNTIPAGGTVPPGQAADIICRRINIAHNPTVTCTADGTGNITICKQGGIRQQEAVKSSIEKK